jgi:hypothetical protein
LGLIIKIMPRKIPNKKPRCLGKKPFSEEGCANGKMRLGQKFQDEAEEGGGGEGEKGRMKPIR